MFRCQFSGEVSDPAVNELKFIPHPNLDGKRVLAKVLVKPAEKPVKVVIKTRSVKYENFSYDKETNRRFKSDDTYGTEIVKEILVRAKYLEAVKKKFGLE